SNGVGRAMPEDSAVGGGGGEDGSGERCGRPDGPSALPGRPQKSPHQIPKLFERLDIRHVAGARQRMELGPDQAGGHPGRVDRYRIRLPVNHQRRNAPELRQGRTQIVVAETVPDLLLGPAGYPEWRKLAGAGGVEEVGRDGQLEDALLERRRVALAEAALPELPARLLKGGVEIPAGERGLEPFPRGAPGRSGRHEREP